MAGWRLDRCLAQYLTEFTRTRLQALVRQALVQIDGEVVTDQNRRLVCGERVRIEIPPAAPAEPRGENIHLNVVYEDGDVIVIDKPAGLVVHPAAGHASGTLVNALIAHCGSSLSGIGGVRRPGIVHRLDKDTSGLMVVAKNDAAHQSLSAQFSAHGRDGRLHRAYLAFAWGVPPRPKGLIDAPLDRARDNRLKFAVAAPGTGREARTHFETLDVFRDMEGRDVASLQRLTLETGRTHQIRVHMAHVGHPLLGDPVYGRGFKTRAARLPAGARAALDALDRQALHAAELGFEHPVSERSLNFKSDLPGDMARLLAALRDPVPAQPGAAVVRKRRSKSA